MIPWRTVALVALVGCGEPDAEPSDSPYGCGAAADDPDDSDTGPVFEFDEDAIDNDGDGLSEDEGDCDDNNCNVHPEAQEYNWGIDSNCDGDLRPLYGCGETSYDSLFPIPAAFAILVLRRARRPRRGLDGVP